VLIQDQKEIGEVEIATIVNSQFEFASYCFFFLLLFLITDKMLLARRFMSVQKVETYYARLDEALSLVLIPSHNKVFDGSSAK
jgi:hypothetical protein